NCSWSCRHLDSHTLDTTEVRLRTRLETRMASLRRYRQRVGHILRAQRPTERAAPIAPQFREALTRLLEASGDAERIQRRNPGEVFRQYATCMLRRLDQTLAVAEGREVSEGRGYATADDLVADLRTLEAG